MTEIRFDALCIGNAICDVFAHVEEDFLVQEELIKGSMRLIDTDEAVRLYGLVAVRPISARSPTTSSATVMPTT